MHLTLDLIYYYKINKTSLLAILYTFPRVIQIYFPRVLYTLNAYNSLNTFPDTFKLWEKTLYFFHRFEESEKSRTKWVTDKKINQSRSKVNAETLQVHNGRDVIKDDDKNNCKQN